MFIREVASTSVPRRRTSSGYSQQCSSPTVANLRKCPSRKPLNDLRCIYKTTTVGLSASGMSGGIPACVGRKRRTRKGRRRDSAKHSQMSRLLTGFGVPHSVIGKIVATPPANITFLNNRELAGLNVRRSNPFRNPSAGLARSQEATSACDPRTNFETEVFPRRTKVLCALRRVYLRQSGDN